MVDINGQLQHMVDSGEIDRLLHESEVIYRDTLQPPADRP
jgi:polar amino acid transport system substrate-binding protein